MIKMEQLNKLNQEIAKKNNERDTLLHKEMDKFKGKFFQNKKDGVVKISIFKVETTYWSNAIDYTRCFYCNDDMSSWWEIDKQSNLSYEEYDLEKLQEAEEISQDKYNEIRDVIIEQVRKDEIEKIRIKYDELRKNE